MAIKKEIDNTYLNKWYISLRGLPSIGFANLVNVDRRT